MSKTAREKTDLGLPFPTEQLAFAELRRQRFEREAASAAPSKLDPTDKVRQHLRELECMIVALPANTKDQSIAARRIRSMVGDQLAELTWWRPEAKRP